MDGKKLKNAPLKEVIFELFWELKRDPGGFPVDEGFELAIGSFESRISSKLPVTKRLQPPGMTIKIFPMLAYQFWKGPLEWPIVQMGPGIITVNDTEKNYVWPTYRNQIHEAITHLASSYKEPLKFNRVTLKYVDSVDVDVDQLDINEYIGKNFKTGIVNNFTLPGVLKGVNMNQVFDIEDGSVLVLNIQSAVNNSNGKPAIVWITSIENKRTIQVEEIFNWLDKAHAICSDIFKEIMNPDFYAGFDK